MRINLPNLFNQMDSRWGSKLLGFNKDPKYNFYNFACLICCEAMVSLYYGKDETPVTINDKLKALGPGAGFVAGSGNYVWQAISKLHPEIKERVVTAPAPLTDGQLGEIKSNLDNGHPVMLQIDVNPRTVENDTHYVLAVDYNPNDENDLTIADPLGGQARSLKEYLGWYRPSARKTIEKYILFNGPKVTHQDPGSVTVPGNIYPDIIHGSTEWDKTSTEYLPERDPKKTNFEDVQRVVNGYKSRSTQLENERNEALKKQALAEQEVVNQKDKLANELAKCQREIDVKNAEISALSGTAKAIEKLRGEYQATISALEIQLREAQKAKGLADTEVTTLKSKLEAAEKGKEISEQTGILAALFEKLFGKR